jgi:hypothetical protein
MLPMLLKQQQFEGEQQSAVSFVVPFSKVPSSQSKNFIFNAMRMTKQSGLKLLLLSLASTKLPST